MEMRFDVTGERRKELVSLLCELTGEERQYLGVPSLAYQVGQYQVSREGAISTEESNKEEFFALIRAIEKQGFPLVIPPARIVVSIPLQHWDEAMFGRLENLLQAKGELFKLAFQTETLCYEANEDELQFRWFHEDREEQGKEVQAYLDFIGALDHFLERRQRIGSREARLDNPKFTFRTFLNALGLVGDKYKETRRILCKHLQGDSSFRTGERPNPKTDTQEESGDENR